MTLTIKLPGTSQNSFSFSQGHFGNKAGYGLVDAKPRLIRGLSLEVHMHADRIPIPLGAYCTLARVDRTQGQLKCYFICFVKTEFRLPLLSRDVFDLHVGLLDGELSPPSQEAFGGGVNYPEQGIIRR